MALNQRYTAIIHDPLQFSVAQGIFWLSWERLSRSTLYLIFNRGGREESVLLYSCTLLAVPRWFNYCCIMQILPLLCRQGSMLLIETVHLQFIDYPMYTVTQYNFSRNGNGRKITQELSTVMSCIDLSVRLVSKSISLRLINQWRLLTLVDMELEQCMW